MVWGGNPIWLPFQANEPLCACVALASVELHDPLSGVDPDTVALFTTDEGLPLAGFQLDTALANMLGDRLPRDTAKLYTWHSARIFLATMLLEANASHAQIRALCRWQTDNSIAIYARLNSLKYKSLLDAAMQSRVTTARANNLADALPFIDAADIMLATQRYPPPAAADLDMNVHPDDDADEDGLDDEAPANSRAPASAPSTPVHSSTRSAHATPVTRPASPLQRLVDLGDDGVVALATSDALSIAGVTVSLPDACWPEWSDTASSTMCTVLGPLASDESLYAVDALGVAYTFPATEVIRFLRAADRDRARRLLKRRRS